MTVSEHPDSAPLDYPAPRVPDCPFDPPPAVRELQRQGPLVRVRLWNGTTPWLVTRYAEQRALLGDPRVSVNPGTPGYPLQSVGKPTRQQGLGFLRLDDPEHRRQRSMVTAPFTIRRIEAMRPAVQEIVDGLIDDLLAGPNPADLVDAFALPVPSLVICRLLGVPYEDHEFFEAESKILIRASVSEEEREASRTRLSDYLIELVGRKLAEPDDGVLSLLAGRIETGELTPDDVAQMAVLLLVAGHETTANMIALGTFALLQHPDELARLRAAEDPQEIADAVEELLRYLSVVQAGLRRAVLEDIELDGQVIRAGEGLIVANVIGNRDPDAFPDPDRLDLRRAARHHTAFGFGVHQCLGQTLARMELQVVYGTLYRRIPTLRLAVDPAEVPLKHDGFIYGAYCLPLAW